MADFFRRNREKYGGADRRGNWCGKGFQSFADKFGDPRGWGRDCCSKNAFEGFGRGCDYGRHRDCDPRRAFCDNDFAQFAFEAFKAFNRAPGCCRDGSCDSRGAFRNDDCCTCCPRYAFEDYRRGRDRRGFGGFTNFGRDCGCGSFNCNCGPRRGFDTNDFDAYRNRFGSGGCCGSDWNRGSPRGFDTYDFDGYRNRFGSGRADRYDGFGGFCGPRPLDKFDFGNGGDYFFGAGSPRGGFGAFDEPRCFGPDANCFCVPPPALAGMAFAFANRNRGGGNRERGFFDQGRRFGPDADFFDFPDPDDLIRFADGFGRMNFGDYGCGSGYRRF